MYVPAIVSSDPQAHCANYPSAAWGSSKLQSLKGFVLAADTTIIVVDTALARVKRVTVEHVISSSRGVHICHAEGAANCQTPA